MRLVIPSPSAGWDLRLVVEAFFLAIERSFSPGSTDDPVTLHRPRASS